jgi:2-phosphosulfolactate phosphatase
MNIDLVFAPFELEKRDLQGKVVVVIDALRATSTMIEAFKNGCSAFIPVLSIEDAKRLMAETGNPDIRLGGERGGLIVNGFHFGNSPKDYQPEKVKGKTVIMTTTNGTRALVAAKKAAKVFIGAFLNRAALAKRLIDEGRDVTVACSGEKDRFCMEDTVCAGAIIDYLEKAGIPLSLSDSAWAAKALYKTCEADLCRMLFQCEWGRHLESIGLGDDVETCGQMDSSEIVPIYHEGRVYLDR